MEKNNRKVCIIYTGGTIGMVPTDQGFAPEKGYLTRIVKEMDDLKAAEMPDWDIIEYDPLLDSSNIAVNEWNEMGRTIQENYDKYDGFVILHGTDTMAYTASALSFMLKGLNKPVIITGSQIPLSRVRSDGKDNLITSVIIAGQGVVREVCLYFGGKLLRGNRATKESADGLLAFNSPNFPPLAEAGIEIVYLDELLYETEYENLTLHEFQEIPIGVIKIFPGIQFSVFEPIITDRLKGLVLETFGAGNIPNKGEGMLPMVERAFANGTVVTVCSQCQRGTVKLGAYETSAGLRAAGAVSGYNMTTEAAVTKLYYLFSRGFSNEEVKHHMERSLRGELDE